MTLSGFVSATALLLLLPGPTNTLLALAGGERGFLRAIPLVRYELCAYLFVVAVLSTVGGQFSTIIPHFSEAVAVLSGTWVAVLAIRLWPRSGIDIHTQPSTNMASLIFWTTIVNPKGFVIGLALIPQGGDAMQKLFAFTVFAMLIVAVASLWCWSGSMFTATTRGNTRLLRQLASIALCCLSLMLVSSGMRMMA